MAWKNASTYIDAIGIAPYADCGDLGGSAAPHTALLSQEQVLNACYATVAQMQKDIQTQVNISKSHNKTIISYEAGMGLVEQQAMINGQETAGLTNLFLSVNRNTTMRDVYFRYLLAYHNAGLDSSYPIMHFTSCGLPSKYGSFGLLEYTNQDRSTAPKFLAVQDFYTMLRKEQNRLYGSISSKS
jgi:hypothetical protein